MKCHFCNEEIPDASVVCPWCGTRNPAVYAPAHLSQTTHAGIRIPPQYQKANTSTAIHGKIRPPIASLAFLGAILLCLGVLVVRRYPDFLPIAAPRTITPLAFLKEAVPTPVPVPTTEPTARAARSIPVPERIPTLDLVKDLVTSSTPATLELVNDWNSVITLDFGGLRLAVNPGGSESRQFPPGSYEYTASTSNCGSPQTSRITLEANAAYSIHFYCSSTGVFADQPGTDYATFEAMNNSSVIISLRIGDRTYRIPPGSNEIRLAPGTYAYSASAPGVAGTASKNVTLSPGERFSVSYTITSSPF